MTVTYKANDKKGRKEEDVQEEDEEVSDDDEQEEGEVGRDLIEEDEEEVEEDSVVPTPPSLPSELARAFDFHKKKAQGRCRSKDIYSF